MKAKKLLAIILCFCMLSVFATPISAASPSSSIRVTSIEETIAGSVVSVPIMLEKNSGFVSLSLTVSFDSSALILEMVTDTGKLKGGCFEGDYDSPYNLVWENDIATTNNTFTGEIAVLQFRIKDNANPGKYKIDLSMTEHGALDKNGNEVTFTLNSGTINVLEADHICSFGDWDEYTSKRHFRTCSECDKTDSANHNFDNGKITEEPSHGNDGVKTYTCKDCGYKDKELIDGGEHNFGSWTKLNDVQHKRSCSCGEIEREDHNWDDGVITKQPTATTEGVKTYTCDDCGHKKTESIQPNPIPVNGIDISNSQITLDVGKSQMLTATVKPSGATNKNVIWRSSNTAVATVSNGVVTAKKAGTTTITVTTEDGSFSAQCVVTVKDPAPSKSASVIIDSTEAKAGDTIKVNVRLDNNPGLSSLVLKVFYDQSLLTLTNVEYNNSMGGQTVPPETMKSPVTLYWVNGFADYTGNGIFATLTFTVSKNAKEGSSSEITVTYNANDVFNIKDENINLDITEGKVTIVNYVPGDINGDGKLDNKDVTRFMQYNAGWSVQVNTAALDVNGDGRVDNKDVTRLMQYNAGWNVEIH